MSNFLQIWVLNSSPSSQTISQSSSLYQISHPQIQSQFIVHQNFIGRWCFHIVHRRLSLQMSFSKAKRVIVGTHFENSWLKKQKQKQTLYIICNRITRYSTEISHSETGEHFQTHGFSKELDSVLCVWPKGSQIPVSTVLLIDEAPTYSGMLMGGFNSSGGKDTNGNFLEDDYLNIKSFYLNHLKFSLTFSAC